MTYFIITLIVMLFFIVAMAIGAILGRDPLKGSCGGLGKIMGNKCEICGDRDKCEKRKKELEEKEAV